MKRLMIAIVVMAGSAALSAAELETLKAGSELEAISAEALQQVEVGAIGAPKPENAAQEGQALNENPTAGYLAMAIDTMAKLYRGYLVLESRSVYEAGESENADLLLKLRENSFVARGFLATTLKKKFPFQTVCKVYLKTAPLSPWPSDAVFLRSKTFFSEEGAKKYQKSLAADAPVTVYFTVHYNYREISESPFKMLSIEMPWDKVSLSVMDVSYKAASMNSTRYIHWGPGAGFDDGPSWNPSPAPEPNQPNQPAGRWVNEVRLEVDPSGCREYDKFSAMNIRVTLLTRTGDFSSSMSRECGYTLTGAAMHVYGGVSCEFVSSMCMSFGGSTWMSVSCRDEDGSIVSNPLYGAGVSDKQYFNCPKM